MKLTLNFITENNVSSGNPVYFLLKPGNIEIIRRNAFVIT